MIVGVVAGLLFGKPAYYLSLLWCCAAIFVFMVSIRALTVDNKQITEDACSATLSKHMVSIQTDHDG